MLVSFNQLLNNLSDKKIATAEAVAIKAELI